MELVIITGVSGSGKSTALNALEDVGYFAIDNLPLQLLLKLTGIFKDNDEYERVAIVADVRAGSEFLRLSGLIEQMRKEGFKTSVLFLDANRQVVRRRYRETRRNHPLDSLVNGNLDSALSLECDMLASIKQSADFYLDTSHLTAAKLRESVLNIFLDNATDSMTVNFMSFGYKFGTPLEADLVFDVRCLPNPFYVDELKEKTGQDKVVQEYVMNSSVSVEFLQKLCDLLDLLIPEYAKEGKNRLVIAVGCTGGKHRSVTFCERLYQHTQEQNFRSRVLHRDLMK